MFKVGDTVEWVSQQQFLGRTATVFKTDGSGYYLYVHWHHFGGNDNKSYQGPWFESRFKPLASTPFEQAVQDYIRSELTA